MKHVYNSILFVILFTANLQAQTSLEYRFSAGDMYELQLNSNQDMIQSFSGMEQTIKNNQESVLSVNVLSVENGEAVLELRHLRMNVFVDVGMMQLEFDTEKEVANPFNSLLKGMVDEPFTVTISSKGKVKSVEGVEKVLANAEKKATDIPADQMAQIRPMLSQQFSNQAMLANLQNSFLVYPDNDLTAGSSWSSDLYMGDDMGATMAYDWTLESASADNWQISGLGVIFSENSKTADIKDLEGTSELLATVNPESGLPSEVTVDVTLSGYTEVDQGAGPIKVDMDIKSVQTSGFKKVDN